MAGRFDPYNDEIWGCFCPLCMKLARAAVARTGLDEASDALFSALEDGTHRHEDPHVSLVKRNPMNYRSDGSDMREGLGIGMTPGGVTGSTRRGASR